MAFCGCTIPHYNGAEVPMRHTTLILLSLIMALGVGCRPDSDKVPKAENVPTPPIDTSVRDTSTTNDRATTQQKLSAKLEELDAKMAELKTKAQQAGGEAKAEWEARRPQMEAQREAAAKRLDELKQSGKEAWDVTRTKTEAAFNELEKGFKEAWGKLKE